MAVIENMDSISPHFSLHVTSAADKVIKRFHQELITSINHAIHEAVAKLRGDTIGDHSNVKDRAFTIGLDPFYDVDTCAALGCLASNGKQQTCLLRSARSSIVHNRHNKYTCNRSAAMSKSLIEHCTEDAEFDKNSIEIDGKIDSRCELLDPVKKTAAHRLESSGCIDISDGTSEEPAEGDLSVPWTDLNDIPLDAMYEGLEFFPISEGISADAALQQVRSPETSHPRALLLDEEQCIPKECEKCKLLDLPPAHVDGDEKVKSTPYHGDTAFLGVDDEVPSDEQQHLSTTSPVGTAAETQGRESEASCPGLLVLDEEQRIAEERQQHRSLGLPAHGVDEVQGLNEAAHDETTVLGMDHTVPSEEQRHLSTASLVDTAVETPPRTPEDSLRDVVILDWEKHIPEEAEQCKSLGLSAANYHATSVLGMDHEVSSSKNVHLSTMPSVNTTAEMQMRSREASHADGVILDKEQTICEEHEEYKSRGLPTDDTEHDEELKVAACYDDTMVWGNDHEVPSNEHQQLSTKFSIDAAAEMQGRSPDASQLDVVICGKEQTICEEHKDYQSLALPTNEMEFNEKANCIARYDDTPVVGRDYEVPSNEHQQLSNKSSVETAAETQARSPEASHPDVVIFGKEQTMCEEHEDYKSLVFSTNGTEYDDTMVLEKDHEMPFNEHQQLSTKSLVDVAAETQGRSPEAPHLDAVICGKEQTICEEHEDCKSLALPTNDTEYNEEVVRIARYDDIVVPGRDYEVPSSEHQQLSTKSSVDTAAESQARSPEASHPDVVIFGKEQTICAEHEDYKSHVLPTHETECDDTVVLEKDHEVPFKEHQQLSTKSSVDTAAKMQGRSPEASHLDVVTCGKEQTICEEHEDYQSLASPTNDTECHEKVICIARHYDTVVLGRDYEVPSNKPQQLSTESLVETAAEMQARSPEASQPDVVIFGTEQTMCEEHGDYKLLVSPTSETEYDDTMELQKDHEVPFSEHQQLSTKSSGDSSAERQARSSEASHPDVVICDRRQRMPEERERAKPPGLLTDNVGQDEEVKSAEHYDDTAVFRVDHAMSSGTQQHRSSTSSVDADTETQGGSPEASHAHVVILKKERSIPEEQVQGKSLGLMTDGMEVDEELKGAAHFDDTVVLGMDQKVPRNKNEHLPTTSLADPAGVVQGQSTPKEREEECKSVGLSADGNDDKHDNEKEQAMPKKRKLFKSIGFSADGTDDNNAGQSKSELCEHFKSVGLSEDGTDDKDDSGEEHSVPEQHEHCKSFGLSADDIDGTHDNHDIDDNDDNNDNNDNNDKNDNNGNDSDSVSRTVKAGFHRHVILQRKWHQLGGTCSQSLSEEREQCKSAALSADGIDDKDGTREEQSTPEEHEHCKSYGLPATDNAHNNDRDDTDKNDGVLRSAKAGFRRPAMLQNRWSQLRARFSSRSLGREEDILVGDVRLTKIVAIIVPYRPQKSEPNVREGQLAALKSYFGRFLHHCTAQFILVVAQQTEDGNKFNRGQVLNVGYRIAQDFCHMIFRRRGKKAELDSVIFHDCDLLPPLSMICWYEKVPERGKPVNLSAPNLCPAATRLKYHDDVGSNWPPFFGGAVALHPADFEACNGFANDYWGWGLEDVELWQRLKESNTVKIECPVRPMSRNHGLYIDLDENNMTDQLYQNPQHAFQNLVNDRVTQNSPPSGSGWNGENGLKGLSWRIVAERLVIMRGTPDIDAHSCTLCSGTGFPLPVLTVVVELLTELPEKVKDTLSTPLLEGETADLIGTAQKNDSKTPNMETMPGLQDKLSLHNPRVALDANLVRDFDYTKDFKGTIWVVIGGFESSGIIVRRSVNLNTPAYSTRLGHGARINEIQRCGPRIEYFKVGGQGPDRGWVSMVYKGESLLMTEQGFSALEILALTKG